MNNDQRYLPVPMHPQGLDYRYWEQVIHQRAAGWPERSIPPGYPIPQFPPPEYTTASLPPIPYMQTLHLPYPPPPMPWSTPPSVETTERTKSSTEIPQSVWLGLFLVLLMVLVPFAWTSLSKGSPSHVPDQPRVLTRINQMDASQYNDGQYGYAPSACSAAAMTEVINYYRNGKYRIADLLTAEIDAKAITREQGLLNGYISVRDTIDRFDATLTTRDMSGSSLESVIATANSGKPLIVGWPPTPGTWWSGGHLLIVRGGDTQNVELADSSSYNIQTLNRATFETRWRGFAVLVEPK